MPHQTPGGGGSHVGPRGYEQQQREQQQKQAKKTTKKATPKKKPKKD